MVNKFADYELSELLNEVVEKGYIVISGPKLLRLLGKGNKAAGTWRTLLDAWIEVRDYNKRNGLHICQIPYDHFILSREPTTAVMDWAGEKAELVTS